MCQRRASPFANRAHVVVIRCISARVRQAASPQPLCASGGAARRRAASAKPLSGAPPARNGELLLAAPRAARLPRAAREVAAGARASARPTCTCNAVRRSTRHGRARRAAQAADAGAAACLCRRRALLRSFCRANASQRSTRAPYARPSQLRAAKRSSRARGGRAIGWRKQEAAPRRPASLRGNGPYAPSGASAVFLHLTPSCCSDTQSG